MDVVSQVLMGVSIASCAGLRTFLPLLVVGILGRAHHVELNPAFAFLMKDDALMILGVAAVLELLADKVIAVDHFLDAVGTLARPIAGTIAASSLLTKMDPVTATTLGLVLGGGTSLTVHAGKAAIRCKATALAPLHAGIGNAAFSLVEDGLSALWLFISSGAPLLGFLIAVALIVLAGWLVRQVLHTGRKLITLLRDRNAAPATSKS